MKIVQNWDGGTGAGDGVALTSGNTNGSGNTAITSSSIGGTPPTQPTQTFSTAIAPHTGTLSARFNANSVSTTNIVDWDMGAVFTELWFRTYLYLPSLPSSSIWLARPSDAASGGNTKIRFGLTTAGLLILSNSASTTIATGTQAVTAATWVRVEGHAIFDATAGVAEYRLYNSPESATATDTLSVSSVAGGSTGSNHFQFGSTTANNNGIAYFDDLEINNTGWPGPLQVAAPTGTQQRSILMTIAP